MTKNQTTLPHLISSHHSPIHSIPSHHLPILLHLIIHPSIYPISSSSYPTPSHHPSIHSIRSHHPPILLHLIIYPSILSHPIHLSHLITLLSCPLHSILSLPIPSPPSYQSPTATSRIKRSLQYTPLNDFTYSSTPSILHNMTHTNYMRPTTHTYSSSHTHTHRTPMYCIAM